MEDTQLFRLVGKTVTKKIPCDHVDGQSVVYWEDIEQVFPGVQHVMNGEIIVKPMRDPNRKRIEPHCIKHHPNVVLDVVLSTSGRNGPAINVPDEDATSYSFEGSIVDNLQVTQLLPDTSSGDSALPQSPSSGDELDFKTLLPFNEVVESAQKKIIESGVEQRLVSSQPSDFQVKVLTSSNIHDTLVQAIKGGLVDRPNEQLAACFRQLKDEVAKSNELASKNNEMTSRIMELLSKINDLTSRNNEVTSENNELMTRVIKLQEAFDEKQEEMKQLQIRALDRLALLQKSVRALMTQTYELHEYPIPRLFIVLPADGSWKSLDFISTKFRLYFVCECGDHTKGSNTKIPHHIHLAKHEGYDIDRPNEFFQRYGSYVLTILRMLKFGISVAGIAVPALSHLIRVDALDQATDNLRLLTNTIEPGMNQVIDHIEKVSEDEGEAVAGIEERMESNEALEGADLRQLEMFLKNKDENRVLGNLYRTVTSQGHVKWVCIDHYRENYHGKAAKAFHNSVEALEGSFDENIGSVKVTLRSRMLAEQFYLALEKARSVYELKVVLDWETSQSDFKKLRDTLALTNVGVLELHLRHQDGPSRDILNRNQRYDSILDIMRHPSIRSFTIRGLQDLSKRSSILSRNDEFSNLRHLDIPMHQLGDDIPGVKCLIARSPNLSSLSLGTATLSLRGGELDELTVDALAKVTKNGSGLKELQLEQSEQLDEPFINNISTIVARSELRDLTIYTKDEVGRVRILESIQWAHLCMLRIWVKPGTFETTVMRDLVNSVKKTSGKVALVDFRFYSDCPHDADDPLSMPLGYPLQAFIASLSLEGLVLEVAMTMEQMLSLFRLADFSRLKGIALWAKGFDSVKVSAIMDGLQHATKLKTLKLIRAIVTDEQKERTKANGVTLRTDWY